MAKSILLIDDDELLCDLLASLLQLEGYATVQAGDGEAGLAQLANARFDLVILDLLMPRMDGIRFLRVLADRVASPPPVLVLSASATAAVAEEVRVPGVVGVVRKPVQPPELVARIAALIGPA